MNLRLWKKEFPTTLVPIVLEDEVNGRHQGFDSGLPKHYLVRWDKYRTIHHQNISCSEATPRQDAQNIKTLPM